MAVAMVVVVTLAVGVAAAQQRDGSDPVGDDEVVVAPPEPDDPAVDGGGVDEGPSAEDDAPATWQLGVLPDGTRYELGLPEGLDAGEPLGVRGVVVWAEGPAAGSPIGPSQSFVRPYQLPGYETADGRTNVVDHRGGLPLSAPGLVVEADEWAFHVPELTDESLEMVDELERIEAAEQHGLVVLDLPDTLRFDRADLPVEMDVGYEHLRVVRVDDCRDATFGACSPDGRVWLVAAGGEGPGTADAELAGAEVRTLDPVPAGCPVTVPDDGVVPPADRAQEPPGDDEQWHGTQDLWTAVPRGGQIWSPELRGDDVAARRIPLWSAHQELASLESSPDVTVRAERVDGDAPAVEHHGATNAMTGDQPLYMLTALELPEPGCWELTAEYRDAALSWTVWVPPP